MGNLTISQNLLDYILPLGVGMVILVHLPHVVYTIQPLDKKDK